VRQAAKRLGVSPATAHRRLHKGRLINVRKSRLTLASFARRDAAETADGNNRNERLICRPRLTRCGLNSWEKEGAAMNRISATVLSMACLVTGYALAGSRVRATAEDTQSRRLPNTVNVSDHITLAFAAGSFGNSPSVFECTILDVSVGWVRCATDNVNGTRSQPFTPPPGVISMQNGGGVWYDLARVVMLTKANK
jgi:hypothetical protein